MWHVCQQCHGLRVHLSQFQLADRGAKHDSSRRITYFIRWANRVLDVVYSSDQENGCVYVDLPSNTYWEVVLTANNITSL